jgi:hypothetical protein
LPWPLRLVATDFGWRVGCGPVVSKLTSFTRIAVSREHWRAKTDRLDTELLKQAFIGWLRGEPNHRSMVSIPSLGEEDAKWPRPDRRGRGAQAKACASMLAPECAIFGGEEPGLCATCIR